MSEIAYIYNPALGPNVNNALSVTPTNILQAYLRNFITVAIGAAGLFFFFRALMAGYSYITAGGDKESVQKATSALKSSVIGIFIVLSLFAVTWVIETLFGIAILEMNLPAI